MLIKFRHLIMSLCITHCFVKFKICIFCVKVSYQIGKVLTMTLSRRTFLLTY